MKETYPIPKLQDNFKIIELVYNLLNEHIKLKIDIHPAGEWLLDNFYIIEEIVKQIEKELPLKKYTNFIEITDGKYKGFARIYVLAKQIVQKSESKIEKHALEKYLTDYQKQQTLSMDEIWSIGTFLQIAIIENIADISMQIYSSQIEKYKAENIARKLIESEEKEQNIISKSTVINDYTNNLLYGISKNKKYRKSKLQKELQNYRNNKLKKVLKNAKFPFIEYMSYILKRYGKVGNSYLTALDEVVETLGTSVPEIIEKEHFEIANQKVLMGNCITSLKEIQRIDFIEIFEKINGVEEILKQDPAKVYNRMDYKTKDYYRGKIQEISRKTKTSEIFIARKILELAQNEKKKQNNLAYVDNYKNTNEINIKRTHIGFYLVDDGINELYEKLNFPNLKQKSAKFKTKLYICGAVTATTAISALLSLLLNLKIQNTLLTILGFLLFLIPSSEVAIQIIQNILSKTVKPKLIPKMDFSNGIDKEHSTMVVIPTVLKTRKKVEQTFKNMEIYYLANKSENLYFTLLGDCTESIKEEEDFDNEIIEEGLKQVEILNKKYPNSNNKIPIFNFVYRNRVWNSSENKYMGWERKRGMLNQFNEFLLTGLNPFRINTFLNYVNIKYIITLDSDTDLVLNTMQELVGAMAHILNTPEIDEKTNIVKKGYGIIQPRIGINLDICYKNLFTKIFAGAGGTDSYTNAISDIYQDNFGEGIFTGKGIYDLQIFSKIMKNRIPENTVLSHDLLEGCYLRCGLATDIMLMDGYPHKYLSFTNRLSRWIRGDWQISKWINNNSLNLLSKYKIFDNLRRSLFEISIFISMFFINIVQYFCNKNFSKNTVISNMTNQINYKIIYSNKADQQILYNINKENLMFNILYVILILIAITPQIIELFNSKFAPKEDRENKRTFTPKVSGIKGILIRAIITVGCLPHKAYISAKAIVKTIYRMNVSHQNLLEWTTSEDAEKQAKTDLFSYYKSMLRNVLAGIIAIFVYAKTTNILFLILGVLWIIMPAIMNIISQEKPQKESLKALKEDEKNHLLEIGKRTWRYFETYLNVENNYLIPDNYQEDRKEKIVKRTSSTNIGLSLMAVISADDLNYITNKQAVELVEKILETIENLEKWNGHLYNWYNIETKEPLTPKYVSTVDSGNFVGYLYVIKSWFYNLKDQILVKIQNSKISPKTIEISENEEKEKIKEIEKIIQNIQKIIDNTDFSKLYDKDQKLFSIGFNIEENKLTNSYYDLLASEARQTSLISIAKKDVPAKHWNYLSRTLTSMDGYKGLISWSGTSFEYLMPNIIIPKYEGSLLDESCKFMIFSQKEYTKRLQIPWGITESAFNLKDLHSNYQYKAFGIPWLGLKRGLADEMVVAPYGSILAISDFPKNVYKNIEKLEKYGMFSKYGFYESIDFTPERRQKGKKYAVVKTYMAHHQSMILLSINNLFNKNILQKRFMQNPEIQSVNILLQERMPDSAIITKENKEKVEKMKNVDYEDYVKVTYKKIDNRLIRGNVISNGIYTVTMNQKGEGFSKYKDILINRFKKTADYPQGIFFEIENKNSNYNNSDCKNTKIEICSKYSKNNQNYKYQISFMPDKIEQEFLQNTFLNRKKDECKNTATNIQQNKIINGQKNYPKVKTKISTVVAPEEPVEIRQLEISNLENKDEILEIKSYFEPVLSKKEQDYAHPAFNDLFLVYELDKETNSMVIKRKKHTQNEKEIYVAVNLSTNSETIGDTEYKNEGELCKSKRTLKIKSGKNAKVNLIISAGENKKEVLKNIQKYLIKENISKAFELSKAKNEAESRYLRIKANQILDYEKMMSYMIFSNPAKKLNLEKLPIQNYKQSELWKYGISGDLPIILVKIRTVDETYIVKEVLKAYEFIRTKGFDVDLVILDEEKHSYENYVKEGIDEEILNSQMEYLKNVKGGIFELNKNEISNNDVNLLQFVASIIIDGKKGGLSNSLKYIEDEYLERYRQVENETTNDENYFEISKIKENELDILQDGENLEYFNEYGGFNKQGEYLIKSNNKNRIPTIWSNIMANEKFGTLVTQNLGGYTWYKNSRLNRVSSWINKPKFDIPSEIIYIKDEENKLGWSLGQNPMPDEHNYNIIYGFGYSKFIHKSDDIEQNLSVFVPQKESVKIQILKLKNNSKNKKNLKILFYMKPVLGEDEIKTNGYINLKFDKNSNIITAQNLYNEDFPNDIIYVSCSEKIESYTGNKKFFFGDGDISNPDALKKPNLNNETSLGADSCIAYEINVELEGIEEKEIVFLLGAEEHFVNCKNLVYKYRKIENSNKELENVKSYWNELLGRVQVQTPCESINLILNKWAIYQTMQSRLFARTGYYQSGGAFGFRDQLQDCLSLKYVDPEILKKQIIKHSKHQFMEGDVEHWWHEETGRGIRTRFSDDLLWLVYAVCEYIEFTGDYSILKIETPYLRGKQLEENEQERYDKYPESNEKGAIYDHCIRAIERCLSIGFGEHGLPKIGSGDWNDGFSNVGPKGKGESVWLGFFLYDILRRFTLILENVQEEKIETNNKRLKEKEDNITEIRLNSNVDNISKFINKYQNIMEELKLNLNKNAWDGNWYKRAFTDDGKVLGSKENEECKIDSISQSWSVISKAGEESKKMQAMESLEKHLVDKKHGIIKLLDPPFVNGKIDSGYIKSYLPGVRENGRPVYTCSCMGCTCRNTFWKRRKSSGIIQNDKSNRAFKNKGNE